MDQKVVFHLQIVLNYPGDEGCTGGKERHSIPQVETYKYIEINMICFAKFLYDERNFIPLILKLLKGYYFFLFNFKI